MQHAIATILSLYFVKDMLFVLCIFCLYYKIMRRESRAKESREEELVGLLASEGGRREMLARAMKRLLEANPPFQVDIPQSKVAERQGVTSA